MENYATIENNRKKESGKNRAFVYEIKRIFRTL